eukprot:TRINITY_DN2957_c0_g2_i18.p2 TRINITY_DN2957_c0_g2~~TRINITY_DN2957_c0_g2_i18.p2  ORF type:complete len:134 (+),score=19.87 TRINITY_DN2957_c0_g2_i18:380-781(+)
MWWPPTFLLDSVNALKRAQTLTEELIDLVLLFFQDPLVKEMLMEKGDALHLPGGGDGITHLLTKLREYFKPDFVPTKEDIIRVRVKTTGIIETTFELKGVQFIVCDVGGQRSERRQWIKCFSNVDAVIYLVLI